MMQTTLMFTLLATATATMTKWDTTCGSKFDRIDTTALTMTTAGGKFAAGDTVTIGTSGSCNLHGPFMGGAWSVRVYEEGFAHPVGDFYGDFSKVLSFPDAKNTTFKIDGVQFMLPNLGSTSSNIFQISFTAQDFQHATYFCVDIYYNLDTGKMTTTKNVEASLLTSLMTADAPHQCTTDADCANDCSFCMNDPSKHPPFYCHAKEKGCCDNDKDCPGSYCMNSPGKKKPFYCHGNLDEAPELVKENKKQTCASFGGCYCKSNHYCHVPPQPIHCTTDAQCRSSWYPSSYCQNPDKMGTCHLNMPPRCEQDSDCLPKLVKEVIIGNECCGTPCDDTSECSANMFCCPNHHECMDSSTQSTEGPNCDAAESNGCQSSGTATAVMKLLRGGDVVDRKKEKVLHAESKTHCNEVHVPKSEYKAFMADKGWSFKDYKTGDCEATWNTKEKVTRDTKYKGVYYVKRGKKTSTVFASQNLGGCTTDAQCPSSYCQNHFECHLCGDECCLEDKDCAGSYCVNDPTKTPPYFCHATTNTLLFSTEAPIVQDPFTVTKDPGNFTLASVAMATSTGKFAAETVATVTVKGVVNKKLISGTVKYQIYETGVTSFIASGNSPYFICTHKGCDVAKPVALTLTIPTCISNCQYSLEFNFVLPELKSKSKEFRVVLWGSDQDHNPYDFSATITYNSR